MSEKAMAREKYDSNEGWLEDVIMNAWLENDLKRKRELAHRGLAQEAAIAVAAALRPLRAREEIRENFERWVRESGSFTDWTRIGSNGDYQKPLVQRTWLAWQAAVASADLSPPTVQGEGRVPESVDQIEKNPRSELYGMERVYPTAPPAPTPEGGEIETALRQVWSDWEIAADAAEVDDYQIKDVAPETVEAVAHALGFLLPAPRTPQTACLGGVEGLTSEPCPKCGATEDDDCKAPFPAPPVAGPKALLPTNAR